MSLNTQMKALKHAVEAGALPSVVGAFGRAEMALRQSGILERALRAGERMPEFTLPDTRARAVALARLLLRGPVVVSFYRGDWCDYCAMELAALTAIHDQVKGLGATLIGISPQAPEARISKRRPTCRPAGGATYGVRVRDQSQNRAGARPRNSADNARARRRGDRMRRAAMIGAP